MADVRGNANTNALAVVANDAQRAFALDRLGDQFLCTVEGLSARAGMAGRLIVSGDAAVGDLVLGQTSFVATTPTFALHVPTGSLAVPLEVVLQQAGTVAGGAISVVVEISSAVGIYASGGIADKQVALYPGSSYTTACQVYSNPTTTAGYGCQIAMWLRGMDISSAEGAPTEIVWRPAAPIFLLGPVSLKVYTWAASTGPSWLWSFKYADLPTTLVAN